MILQGPRVMVRPLGDADAADFARMNADPEVMRHFVARLSRAESEAMRARCMTHLAAHGFGFCGVFARDGRFLGMVGLNRVGFGARFTPAVEIGWRIARAEQRQGYAEEAAFLCLAHGFGSLGLPEIVAWTIPANEPSWRLMEKLGMRADGCFEEPRIPPGHPKRRQLLYRLRREDWAG